MIAFCGRILGPVRLWVATRNNNQSQAENNRNYIVLFTLGLLFALSLVGVTAQAGPGRAGRGANWVGCPERPKFYWADPDTDGNKFIRETETAAAIERMAERRPEMIEWRNPRVLKKMVGKKNGVGRKMEGKKMG